MIALLLASSLAATPARALPDAEAVLFVPKLDKAAPLFTWLSRAGARSPLLRPATWRAELSPLLGLDVGQSEALAAAGIDPAGSATFSFRKDDRVGCFTLKDVAEFEKRVQAQLTGMGDRWKAKEKGATLVGAAVGSRVVGGYALKGKEACTVTAPSNAGPVLKEIAAALGKSPSGKHWARVAKLPGVAFLVSSRGAAGLRAEGEKAVAEGVIDSLPGMSLGSAAPSPYGAVPRSGLFFSRFRLGALGEYAEGFRKRNLKPCRFCDPATNDALTPLAAAVASAATGNGVVRVEQFVLKGTLRSEAAQYFALKNALVLELSDAASVKKALDALSGFSGATKTDLGLALSQPQGQIHLALSGKHFAVASDGPTAAALLGQVKSEPQAAAHSAEWFVEPSRVTQAFSQVSLLDVMGSRELAGLFAVGTELGPLFGDSQLVSGSVDRDENGYRWAANWLLKSARPSPAP